MHWHQARQRVLAENVANSDTPGFRPRDLVEPKFGPNAGFDGAALPLRRTASNHLTPGSSSSRFADQRTGYETRPAGNGVSLEDEMMKVAANQMDFAAATTLYGRSLRLLKTAIGKG